MMRLLKRTLDHHLKLVLFNDGHPPLYAILSHTWSEDQEITYNELLAGTGRGKTGYKKILFCVDQAAKDSIEYCWVDTCCIDKSSQQELQTAINSMFHWYQDAEKCYVYLSDVRVTEEVSDAQGFPISWMQAFRRSRWFTRSWTLQELLAPANVEFFSKEGKRLGSRISLEQEVSEITRIPVVALRGKRLLSEFSIDVRMSWAIGRTTTFKEDKIYSLLGIFGVIIPLLYGEGETQAEVRLREEIERRQKGQGIKRVQDLAEMPTRVENPDRSGSVTTKSSQHSIASFLNTLSSGKRRRDRDQLEGSSRIERLRVQHYQQNWAFRVSSTGVLKCVASPQKTYVAFVHATIIEVFDLHQPANGSSNPVVSFDATKIYGNQTTWKTCCFSTSHLFLVPTSAPHHTRGLLKLLIYPIASAFTTQPIRIEVTSRFSIELIAATTAVETPVLACVVLDSINDQKPWGVLGIPLDGLSEWSRAESSSSSNFASHTAGGTLPHHVASSHFEGFLSSPKLLDVPLHLPGMKYLDLQFCPRRPTLVLTTENSNWNPQACTHFGVYLWWWDLDDARLPIYQGHQFFENEGKADQGGKMHVSTAVATDQTAFAILHHHSVFLRTPVRPNVPGEASTFLSDQISRGRKAMFRLVVTDLKTRDVYFVAEGSTKREKDLIGVYRQTLTADLKFERPIDLSRAWACTSKLRIANHLRNPLLALLFAPDEWHGNRAWVMVLINYEGKVEALDLLDRPQTE